MQDILMGKLFALLANIRLAWKNTGHKYSSVFCLTVSDREKKFFSINISKQDILSTLGIIVLIQATLAEEVSNIEVGVPWHDGKD